MGKVLIVEDQPAMASMVRHHVEGAGFEVVTATDVDSAWGLIATERLDAAIVDIQLPGKDGWDLISRSRIDERTRDLPIVVLTGLHGSDVRRQAEAFSAEYFTKPFAASLLVTKLRKMVHGDEPEPLPVVAAVPDTIESITELVTLPLPVALEVETETTADGANDAAAIDSFVFEVTSVLEETPTAAPPPPAARPVERETVRPTSSPEGDDQPLGHVAVELLPVKVALLTDKYQVEGTIHMPLDHGRFSDAWEAMFKGSTSFVPVTDAKVIVDGGPKAVATCPFLQVKKSDITGIFPTDI